MKWNFVFRVQSRMKDFSKNIILSILLIITGCKETSISPEESLTFIKLEYKVTGGFAGINEETVIYENGEAEFIHSFRGRKYIINVNLTKKQLNSINSLINTNKINELQDEYKPDYPVMDGFYNELKYTSKDGNKKIKFESGITLPQELTNIADMLYELREYMKLNSNFATLTNLWDREEIIKTWLFPNIKLENKAFFYDTIENSNEILNYFESIRNNFGYSILYLQADSLYSIYDGGTDYGYFNVHEVFTARLWRDVFDVDIKVIQNEGLVKTRDEWMAMNISFDENHVFVIDKIEDNGKALKLKLIPGKPIAGTK